ncbi:adenylate/guanylate cyclase domain-containing protein [Cnuella takakiae]|uniref:adenylate/guanylate cyclase domain-containing protein n=1 Tax=Cnuella takakiae TaxID=1302690 RepID=UPI001300ED1A|nr:adenylate/guanylate cyclase domain-containing protein [Cnuella takakiae]
MKGIVAEGRNKSNLNKGMDHFNLNLLSKTDSRKKVIQEQRAFSNSMHLSAQPLGAILNGEHLKNAKLGQHPDFVYLKGTDDVEYHYIVSVFIDIQGSTNLHKKYDLEDIFRITNTIQSAAIHTCIALGGHVQRLQGDGVFAYFGSKAMDKNMAVEKAVTACSMFTYFVQNDLKDLFLEDGIENINTRIGIDFGDDDDVLWANFGLMDVSELTTNSLHTSLASKMQAYASRNGIVVGQYVKDRLDTGTIIFDLVRDADGQVKRYIFEIPEKNFRYTQYAFDWFKFLKTLPFVGVGADGKLYIINQNEADRMAKLRNTAALLSSGTAYLNGTGTITPDQKGVQHQPHRFHYGK